MNKLIAGNLKANILNLAERERYLVSLKKNIAGKKWKDAELVICPSSVHLEYFAKNIKNKAVKVGAQNVFWENEGSFTGEVTAPMVKSLGCEYVILGHSERRKYFSENNREVNLKVLNVLKNGLKPILCVGENISQELGAIVLEQLRDCLAGVGRNKIENVVICYEPVWAISSNNPDHLPTANDIMGAKLLIKRFLVNSFGAKIAEKVRIIYGGSVSPANAQEVCINANMDGALVGHESLTPHALVKIAEIINNS